MLAFAKDLPSICSLVGLLSAVLSIFYAIAGNFPAAMIGLIWAVFFDWSDGIIARGMKRSTEEQSAFGGHLDSLIDMVSFGICPAVVLLSYGHFSLWFLPGAFVIVATSAIRLSYFNVFGLINKSTYRGLALDNNVVVLVFVFLFEGVLSRGVFSVIIYVVYMGLNVLNLAPIRTPKLAGRWFYVLIAYTAGLTVFYGWTMWSGT